MSLSGFIDQPITVRIKMASPVLPSGTHSVTFSGPSADPTEVSLPPDFTMTFDSTNWNTPQPMTIVGHRPGSIPINYTVSASYTTKKKKSSFSIFVQNYLPNTVYAEDAGFLTVSDPTVGETALLLEGSKFTVFSEISGSSRPSVNWSLDSSSGDGALFWVYVNPAGGIGTGFPTVNADGEWTMYVCHYPQVRTFVGTPPSTIGAYNVGITVKVINPHDGSVMSSGSIAGNVSCGAIVHTTGYDASGSNEHEDLGTGYTATGTFDELFCYKIQGPNDWGISEGSDSLMESTAHYPVTGTISTPSMSEGSTASGMLTIDCSAAEGPPPVSFLTSFFGVGGSLTITFAGATVGVSRISSPIYNFRSPP